MTSRSLHSAVRRYSVAVLATGGGILVKELLGPTIVPSVYLTSFAAVLVSALQGGLGPGLVSTVLSALLGWYLYLPPPIAANGFDATTTIRVALFVAISSALSWLVDRSLLAHRRLAASERALRAANAELERQVDLRGRARRVEQRLQSIIDNVTAAIYALDADGRYVLVNREWERLFQLSRADVIGKRNLDVLPRPIAEAFDRNIAAVLAERRLRHFEDDVAFEDGRHHYITVQFPLLDDAGNVDTVCGFSTDVTALKHAQAALRTANTELEQRVGERTAELRALNRRLAQELAERTRIAAALQASEDRYRQVSELASDFAYSMRCLASGEAVFEWSAGAFERITGFSEAELGVSGGLSLVHPDDADVVLQRVLRLQRGESDVSEYRIVTRTGEVRWLRDYARAEWDAREGRVVRIVGAAQDITERRNAEAALRESEQRFALAVAGANDGLWDWNLETDTVYLSPRWKQILGFDDEEVGSDPAAWVERVHPDDSERVATDVRAHLTGKTPHFQCEYRLRHKDGCYRWVHSRAVAVRDAGGKPYRMAGSLSDITARKQAEAEAHRRQTDFAHAQRVSTLGEMAAGLAHELNQPLAAIVSYARGCVRRMRAGDAQPTDLLHAIEQVAKQALRAGEILQRYRSFLRTGTTSRERVDLNALVREVAQMTKSTAREERVTIRLDLAPDLPRVEADAVQIEQVLVNLVRNGLDAMQGSRGGELWMRTSAAAGAVEVAVQDSGRGLPAFAGDRIFEAFFTTKPNGLGMGLSISRSIVEAHGGRIWADPGPGRGTTFRISLPTRHGEHAYVREADGVRGG